MHLPQRLNEGPAAPLRHELSAEQRNSPLMKQAQALEAAFLSELLGYAGVGESKSDFGGGIGEQQFASFLRDEQAKLMVANGGIGLAEQLFNSMIKGQENAG